MDESGVDLVLHALTCILGDRSLSGDLRKSLFFRRKHVVATHDLHIGGEMGVDADGGGDDIGMRRQQARLLAVV